MMIPADEAASALRDAEAAAGRSAQAHGYRNASGHLFVWGAVWGLANAFGQVSERAGGIAWMVLVIVGVVASLIVGRRQADSRTAAGQVRALLIAAAIGGFAMSVQVISPPLSFAQTDAIATLVVGAVYIAMGSSAGLRLSAVGAAVMAATMVGWLFLRDWFFLWTAAVGGGALILGGVWFRKA